MTKINNKNYFLRQPSKCFVPNHLFPGWKNKLCYVHILFTELDPLLKGCRFLTPCLQVPTRPTQQHYYCWSTLLEPSSETTQSSSSCFCGAAPNPWGDCSQTTVCAVHLTWCEQMSQLCVIYLYGEQYANLQPSPATHKHKYNVFRTVMALNVLCQERRSKHQYQNLLKKVSRTFIQWNIGRHKPFSQNSNWHLLSQVNLQSA